MINYLSTSNLTNEELIMRHLQRPKHPLPYLPITDYIEALELRVGSKEADIIYDRVCKNLELIGLDPLNMRSEPKLNKE